MMAMYTFFNGTFFLGAKPASVLVGQGDHSDREIACRKYGEGSEHLQGGWGEGRKLGVLCCRPHKDRSWSQGGLCSGRTLGSVRFSHLRVITADTLSIWRKADRPQSLWLCFLTEAKSLTRKLCAVIQAGFLGGASGKEPTWQCRRRKRHRLFLGQEDPLKEGTATHSSILAWRIPWTEESGGLQSMGSQRVGHDWSDLAHTLREFHRPFYLILGFI